MIISDHFQFAFVHIPKCAGTTVRMELEHYDDTEGAFTNRVDDHAELGRIDYVHIPLFILRKYFLTEYKKIRDYDSYAVVRDPYSRFPSSFSQHLNFYGKSPIHKLKSSEIKREIDLVIQKLQKHRSIYLPYQYIHFQRQIDYVCDQNEILVSRLYTISDVRRLLADISSKIGAELEQSPKGPVKANQAIVYRHDVLRSLDQMTRIALGPALRRLVPSNTKKKLKHTSRKFFYVPRQKGLSNVFESKYIRDFIGEYYSSDITLYRKILRQNKV